MAEIALIVGAGTGLSAALARLFHKEGMSVALAARRTDKLAALSKETHARAYACDAERAADVEALFKSVVADMGPPNLVVYNPSYRTRGPVAELDPQEVLKTITVTCFGGFLVAQQAARLMLKEGHGTILFTGASASIKGYARSAPFAMGKFGLRGLAQSMARELAPQNIHVAHFVIDGGIRRGDDPRANERGPDGLLEPDAIAQSYLHVHRQKRSAWTAEIELRPWVESY
ncbi:MAG TPA: SDR family NAD(P)-dependent oxidoreductase [Stellaceae bacterium]|jgi:NAD(P)-dependent dehydrogenase (short-subunit alcohol dehydrogenase family)|nr:SDR family NAD(P)-dependent oxidoreductase [Stellaceae bacterium]